MDTLDVEHLIYLDNAATVYPKPAEVLDQMTELYRRYGVNPGRSGYDLCLLAEQYVRETRSRMTELFGGEDPERICFDYNASDALNVLIQGLVGYGDHVVSTTLEHNSVIRPLNHLRRDRAVEIDWVRCGDDGIVDPDEIAKHFRSETRAVVLNHGSNVIGTVQPVAEIGRLCREREILLIVDVAQTAGVIAIDVKAMNIDALAFTGHKSLLGPTGIGGMYVGPEVEVRQTRFGGTGVDSAHPYHLEHYPYRLEVGSINILGVFGLFAGLGYLNEQGIESIHRREMQLLARLQDGLAGIAGVRLCGPTSLEHRLPVLSFTVDGLDPADVGTFLDVDHEVTVRTGLQCAPLIHEQLGTLPGGTVRMSIGPANTMTDIEAAIAGVEEIAAQALRTE